MNEMSILNAPTYLKCSNKAPGGNTRVQGCTNVRNKLRRPETLFNLTHNETQHRARGES